MPHEGKAMKTREEIMMTVDCEMCEAVAGTECKPSCQTWFDIEMEAGAEA